MSGRSWERGERGWYSYDPALWWEVEKLPLEVRAGIRAGKSYSYEQAERIRERESKK